MFRTKLQREAGQTIIEGVAAISIIVVILGALSVATITSLNNSTFIKNQSLATKYAQQTMENIRYTRNNDPNTFFNVWSSNTYCAPPGGYLGNNNLPTPTPNASVGSCTSIFDFSGVQFIREVKFSSNSPSCSDGTAATVNVYWSSGKCDPSTQATRFCHSTHLVSCFANPSESGASL